MQVAYGRGNLSGNEIHIKFFEPKTEGQTKMK